MDSQVIVIVEDEVKVASLLADYLKNAGYEVHWFENGNGLVEFVETKNPSLILLDWMLPGMDGINLCKRIRALADIPIIMLTAKSEEDNKLLGFDSGADDYICKPFSPKEVVARVKALLKRTNQQGEWIVLDDIRVSQFHNVVEVRDAKLDLTPTEYHILKIIMANPNKVMSREQLFYKYQGKQDENGARKIDSHIKNLRKKLHHAIPDYEVIRSVYGEGYKLVYPFSK